MRHLLALPEHAAVLDRRKVAEEVLTSGIGLDESETLFGVPAQGDAAVLARRHLTGALVVVVALAVVVAGAAAVVVVLAALHIFNAVFLTRGLSYYMRFR
jgi:hypothetical protein